MRDSVSRDHDYTAQTANNRAEKTNKQKQNYKHSRHIIEETTTTAIAKPNKKIYVRQKKREKKRRR